MAAKPFKFESAMKELDDITQWFESGEVELDEGLAKFERGMELSAALKEHLAGVENRVQKIRERFDGPSQQTTTIDEPFGPSDDLLD